MKLKFYYILFLLWSHSLYGIPVDSLRQLLEQQSISPQIHLTTHLKLAEALRIQGEDSSALSHITIVEKQLIERNFPTVKVHLLLTKGLLAYSQYKDEEALDLFKQGYALNKKYQAGFCVDFCTNLLKVSPLVEAKKYMQEGLGCASSIQDTFVLKEQLGNLYKKQEQYLKAIELYTSNQQIAQSIKDTLLESKVYQNIGGVYLIEGKFKQAANSYLESAKLKEKIGDQKGVVHVQHNLAMVYFEQKQYEKSLEYYQKCTNYYSNNRDTAELLDVWRNIAGVYIAQQKYEQASSLLNQILVLLPKFPNPSVALNTRLNLGNIQLKKENYQAALKIFQSSMEAAQQQGDYFTLVMINNFLGEVYFSLKDSKQSVFHYQEALNTSQALNMFYEQGIALYGLYETNKYAGNTTQALNWYEQYTSIKDSLYNVENTTQIAEAQALYDNLQQEKEIQQLNAENERISLENQLQTKQFYLVLLVGVLLLGGLGVLWWRRQKVFLHQQEIRDLVKTKGEELLEAIVATEQKERKLLAREIHDTLGTFLALLRMQHSSNKGLVDDPTYRERHLTMSDLITQTASEMRRISHQMNTGGQFSFNLQHAIEKLVMFVQTLPKKQIEIIFNYMGEAVELSRAIELALYRTVQESLTNILKHAQATEVTIQINQNAEEITLMIEDNGLGFDVQIPYKGIGLKNMRKRVEALGGTIQVDSHPKAGTCINVQIPMV